jgi:hypothetical protein
MLKARRLDVLGVTRRVFRHRSVINEGLEHWASNSEGRYARVKRWQNVDSTER